MAPSRSVASTTTGPGLNRRLRRWLAAELRDLRPVIEASAAACGAEHSRKHFTSYRHLCLLLFHGLSSHPSLHQSYEHFAACRGLVAASGLGREDGGDELGVGSVLVGIVGLDPVMAGSIILLDRVVVYWSLLVVGTVLYLRRTRRDYASVAASAPSMG